MSIRADLAEPVLIMGFNRPRYLSAVIERVRAAAPRRIYFAVDGPRSGDAEDEAAVDECRSMVDRIDWPCEVRTQFQDVNLGCGAGVTAAISWFFDNEESGIILEDDILPDETFFSYCATLLDRYRDDDRVFAISGCNLVPPAELSAPHLPYRFTQVPHIWGWAAWRRTWALHSLDLGQWRERLDTRTLWERSGRSLTGALVWGGVFEMVSRGLIDTWDYQLVYASMLAGQLTATSNVNLTQNIGVDKATHVNAAEYAAQPVGRARLPLADAPVSLDERADAWTRVHHFQTAARARQALSLSSPSFRQFVEELRQVDREAVEAARRSR